jgi:hypothetical protein
MSAMADAHGAGMSARKPFACGDTSARVRQHKELLLTALSLRRCTNIRSPFARLSAAHGGQMP